MSEQELLAKVKAHNARGALVAQAEDEAMLAQIDGTTYCSSSNALHSERSKVENRLETLAEIYLHPEVIVMMDDIEKADAKWLETAIRAEYKRLKGAKCRKNS